MFEKLKRRWGDIQTIRALCQGAERHAGEAGQQAPGAEHFVLAALDLPEGSARRVMARLNVRPEQFRPAIDAQYRSALAAVGIDASVRALDGSAAGEESELPLASAARTGPYRAQPSGQALMQRLAEMRRGGSDRPLCGADVLAAAAVARLGTACRAFRAMGVDPQALMAAAALEGSGNHDAAAASTS